MPSSPADKKDSRIHILPDDLANKIAAGEVIERPASVVKELLDNSIDAGPSQISIEIEAAGKNLIKVADNGEGMSSRDAGLAFQRHATSKLIRSEDLEAIKTLGFRGEALPSMGSIAKVRLSTANDEHNVGTEILVVGGMMQEVKEIARPRGTTVEVRQLFFNTPARKKFLKGDTTESSHITQVVTQQALAHPHIHFTLTHNGRRIFNTLPTEQGLYRIAELFGAELTKQMIRVEEQDGRYRLEGYISNPVSTRSNRSLQYFYINNRFIRDKVILHATQHGYSHLLPKDQYPVLFLFLSMDPSLVDVNVHPSKAEVRFAFQQEVHHFVSESIRKSLGKNEQIALVSGTSIPPAVSKPAGVSPGSSAHREYTSPALQPTHSPTERQALDLFYHRHGESGEQHPFERFDRKPMPVSNMAYSDFESLGQLDNSFILLQGKKGIVIVDQHIAHERILYERFRHAAKSRTIEVQQLLFPQAVEFSPNEAELLSANLEMLKGLGLELEPFGSNGFLLRSVPAMLKNDDHSELLREIVAGLPESGKVEAVGEKYEEIIIMMACRNAIKVNHPLDADQIRKLLYDLEQTEMPYTCPHGRPIALLMDMDDILKKFLRK